MLRKETLMKRVIVTGANGFVGSHIKQLVEKIFMPKH